ncbi:aminoglycoside phosphotransferase family protein [Nonomuraea sp. NPDC052129]|uniref:aminoglycoside phosphotransferase family protein n=1 Tax=Nonomuraea sp. NPDC052129 TaxID=3154651 RepID=UPI0034202D5C
MTEELLTGGNNALQVARAGDTVRRTRDAGSAFAARVLTHLVSVGYSHAPRYLGIDEHGRDILSFIPGTTTDHPTQRAQGAYAAGGRMLRELHEATASHVLSAGRECVMHGDPGPFNTIFQQGLPVAFIDWSSCRPGDRLDDLGYMAWTWCIQSQGRVPIAEQARHLRELRDGYGTVEPAHLLGAMVRRQTHIADMEAANIADPTLTPARRRHAEAAMAWATADRELIHRHQPLLLSALQWTG